MPCYVHFNPKTKEIVSYQEAPEGQQDPTPDGLETVKVENFASAKDVIGNQ